MTTDYYPFSVMYYYSGLVFKGEKQSCQVCLDNASGYFYDAFICEACKKFFNRALKQNSRPSCVKGNTTDACVINKQTRSSCPACRFKKCLDIGMKPPGMYLVSHSKGDNKMIYFV